MKRRWWLLVGAAAAIAGCVVLAYRSVSRFTPNPTVSLVATEGRGRLETHGTVKVLFLSGGPYERGYQQGRLVRNEVQHLASAAGTWLAEKDAALAFALARSLEADLLPDEIAEMRGLADGAGISYEEILFMNVVHEEKGYPLCSQFAAIDPEGTMVVGRNNDLEMGHWLANCGVVQVVTPERGEPHFTVAHAGMVGSLTGINRNGVYLAVNSCPRAEISERGIPAAFMIRRALMTATCIEDAVSFLMEACPARGHVVLVASGSEKRFAVVETGVSWSRVRWPDSTHVVATNHYLHPDMVSLMRFKDDARQETLERILSSKPILRVTKARRLLDAVAFAPTGSSDRPDATCTLQSLLWYPGTDAAWVSMTGFPATAGEFVLFNPVGMLARGPTDSGK